eukprot:Gb_33518 [translate_table: standard]
MAVPTAIPRSTAAMASTAVTIIQSAIYAQQFGGTASLPSSSLPFRSQAFSLRKKSSTNKGRVVCAFGDVSGESTGFLIAGAVGITLIGTAFPLLFSRKDLCPECDGAGFTRKSGSTLNANAARKDQAQIVCPRCNGLGKLGQVDK